MNINLIELHETTAGMNQKYNNYNNNNNNNNMASILKALCWHGGNNAEEWNGFVLFYHRICTLSIHTVTPWKQLRMLFYIRNIKKSALLL